MPSVRVCRLLAVLGAALCLLGPRARADDTPVVTGNKVTYDDASKETIMSGDARLTYGDILLTADEIRYNATTSTAVASGHFNLTLGKRRLVVLASLRKYASDLPAQREESA